MAGHSVSANLLMLVLLVGGFIMGKNIKKEVFPDFDLDMVNISVAYPGASPEEVEQGIILAIEEAIQGLEGVKEVTAAANEGSGAVTVEVIEGEDAQQIAQDIKNEVDRITSFPEEAEERKITVAKRKRYVVSLALYGDQSERVLREMAEIVRDRLLQDANITQVDFVGVRDHEISIEIPLNTLRAYNLTLDSVAQTLRRAAVELPGGSIKTAAGDVLVRVKERRDYGHEFAGIPIITANDGTQVLLEDIAVITDGFEETDNSATFNGKPAIMIEVYRVGDQTPISVSDAVKGKMAEINQMLPPGLALEARSDRSEIYRQRLDLMLRNGYLGLCLVFVLLAVFLEARLAFWVSLGIPISFLGSLLILPALGLSINMISMFAFIVTLGIVVDDAIVAGENIYYHRQEGLPWLQASVKGARQIAMPVTFSVLTNMVTFMPMFFVPGFMGKIFKQIPIVVICVFSISLVESLFILPAHLGHQSMSEKKGIMRWIVGRQQKFSALFSRMVQTKYGPFLDLVLRWRYVSMSMAVAILLLAVGFIKSGRMGFELFPKVESDYAKATAELPFGSAFEKTKKIQDVLVKAAQEVSTRNGGEKLVEGIYAQINGNTTEVRIYLVPPDERPVSTTELTQSWRDRVGVLPGLESLKFESDAGGPGRGAAITVELSHRDIGVLERASAELAKELAYYPSMVDIDDGFSPGKQQIDFKIKPEGRSVGLRARDVARQVRYAYYGAEVLRQQRGRNEVKVMVRLPKTERISEYNLEEMILIGPTGREIPLREAVNLERGRAYTTIDRRNSRRIVNVSADARPRSKAGEVLRPLKADILPTLTQRYSGLTYSFEGRQADRRESVSALLRGLLWALLVIFAMLAIPFNSYLQPMIIMLSIPFGIVGAMAGHLIMGYSLSLPSLFGVVALSGVVVNDSLILIHFANRRRRQGTAVRDAIRAAAIHRFRPILLTTLTTFGGLSPMMFETSRQARFLIPMAISLGYGILFATVITLLLVPSFYLILEDVQNLLASLKAKLVSRAAA
jgi:multidrug efflux pump subunit AcrB